MTSEIACHETFVSTQQNSLGIQRTAASATSHEAESKTANITLTLLCFIYLGSISGQLSRYTDSLRAGQYRYRIPVRDRFFAPVQTGPGSHSASYTMDTVPFLGVKRPGCDVDYSHLAPRLKKGYSYNFTPLLGLRDLF